MLQHKLAKAIISGVAGSVTQGMLMLIKSRFNILPEFQPYFEIQQLFSKLTIGIPTHYLVLFANFINGAFVLSYLFGRMYNWLPSKHGLIKGLIFGVFGWLLLNLVLFPMVGYGIFASKLNLGLLPSMFSLLMVQTYSLALAFTYAKLINRKV
jgi:hypothetical protein